MWFLNHDRQPKNRIIRTIITINTNHPKMSIFTLILLAFSMSMDAFAAAICKGAAIKHASVKDIIRTALIFGIVETITPLIGWLLGHSTQAFIAEYDHWIAFVLLCILGIRMVRESFATDEHGSPSNPNDCGCPPTTAPSKHGLGILLLTAIATSIDSMVVGVGLAFLDVNIWQTALAIGVATTIMAAVGMSLGKILGAKVGKRAELFGGLVLMGIGAFILVEHLALFK